MKQVSVKNRAFSHVIMNILYIFGHIFYASSVFAGVFGGVFGGDDNVQFDESSAKNVERIDGGSNAVCSVLYRSTQYKINQRALLSCFQNEISSRSDYECLTIQASTSEFGSVNLNLSLLERRASSALEIIKQKFPKIRNYIITKVIDQKRAVAIILSHKNSNGLCYKSSMVPGGGSASIVNKSETKKISILAGNSVFVIKSNSQGRYIPKSVQTYIGGMLTDLAPEEDWGSIYGGVLYMNANAKSLDQNGFAVIYARNDLALLGGINYNLIRTQYSDFSAFFELGPAYSVRSLNLSSDSQGTLYQTYLTLYSAAGLKIATPFGLFIQGGGILSVNQRETYIGGIVVQPFAYGGMIEIGYSF